MNFISLRNVANQEIYDSYCGILRISPYVQDDIYIDDPTALLKSVGEEIKLSDSVGNFLNITFVPQQLTTLVVDENSSNKDETTFVEVNVINVTQKVNNLYVVDKLTVSPTFWIKPKKDEAPIKIINGERTLLFPTVSPEDTKYLNHNCKLFYSPENASLTSINKKFDNEAGDEIFYDEKYDDYHVKINGKKIYRQREKTVTDENGTITTEVSMVPELYKHDYVLGQAAGDTYKNDDKSITTKLSFLNIEKIVWSLLEGSVGGAYRSFEGRYRNLFPTGIGTAAGDGTEDNLFKTLFMKENSEESIDAIEEEIKKNAPLVGLPVQSGLIMYNAIPFRRLIFHNLRRYSEEDYAKAKVKSSKEGAKHKISHPALISSLFMHNLTSEYVLCDGKRIKECGENYTATDYPNINKRSKNWQTWDVYNTKENNISVYDAMANSMGEGNILKTPNLFELNQLSPRYLRALNWHRCTIYNKKTSADQAGYETEKTYLTYNHEKDVIEKDGTYAINEWNEARPEVDLATFEYGFINNTTKIILGDRNGDLDIDDIANIPKDIHTVGPHYANYDYKVNQPFRHVHQPVVNNDLLMDNDELYKVHAYYEGRGVDAEGYKTNFPHDVVSDNNGVNTHPSTSKQEWADYVSLKSDTYLGSYVMRSAQDDFGSTKYFTDLSSQDIKNIQDMPVSYRGGTTSPLRKIRSGFYKYRSHWPKCTGGQDAPALTWVADGGYQLAAYRERPDNAKQGWRFLSSLPVTNKYGSWEKVDDYAIATYNGKEVKIDDTLPSPPSINLIPLMKI